MKKSGLGLFVGASLMSGVVFYSLDSSAGVHRIIDSSACQVMNAVDLQFWDGMTNSKVGTSVTSSGLIRLVCPVIADESHPVVGAVVSVTTDFPPSTFGIQFTTCRRRELVAGYSCGGLTQGSQPGTQTAVIPASQTAWSTPLDFPFLYVVLGGRLASQPLGTALKGYYVGT